MNYKTKQLEALLFTAGEAVRKTELASLLDVPEGGLDYLIGDLSHELLSHGLALLVTGEDVQLVTSPAVGEWLAQFNQAEPAQLSKAALETLAIAAYRGPVSRTEIDLVRGVDSRAMVRQLIKRGLLVRVSQAGKVPTYCVSDEFLRTAGLKRQEDLPEFATLSNNERLAQLLDV